jgi:hypothetical protein
LSTGHLTKEDLKLPEQAVHKSIEAVKDLCWHVRLCDCTKLAPALTRAMQSVTKYRKGEMVCKKEDDLYCDPDPF